MRVTGKWLDLSRLPAQGDSESPALPLSLLGISNPTTCAPPKNRDERSRGFHLVPEEGKRARSSQRKGTEHSEWRSSPLHCLHRERQKGKAGEEHRMGSHKCQALKQVGDGRTLTGSCSEESPLGHTRKGLSFPSLHPGHREASSPGPHPVSQTAGPKPRRPGTQQWPSAPKLRHRECS